MSRVYTSVDQFIGNTPLLELVNLERELGLEAKIFAKLEYLNPTGSAKDRVAKSMIEEEEKEGRLSAGGTIIEPTSGNTGIGLASVAAARGYKVIIVLPETMSVERRALIAAYGAQVVLTPAEEGMAGSVKKAEELAKEIPGAIIAGQFENPANPKAHFETTGPEIWEDCDGKVDVYVATVGTGGTLSGTGNFLKSKNKDIKVVAVEPAASPLLSKGVAGAHGIQGIGANFVPKALDKTVYDEILTVEDSDAFKYAKLLGPSAGVLCGISSGAALKAAVDVAKRAESKGKNIVVVLPDSADRYMSTDLF